LFPEKPESEGPTALTGRPRSMRWGRMSTAFVMRTQAGSEEPHATSLQNSSRWCGGARALGRCCGRRVSEAAYIMGSVMQRVCAVPRQAGGPAEMPRARAVCSVRARKANAAPNPVFEERETGG